MNNVFVESRQRSGIDRKEYLRLKRTDPKKLLLSVLEPYAAHAEIEKKKQEASEK